MLKFKCVHGLTQVPFAAAETLINFFRQKLLLFKLKDRFSMDTHIHSLFGEQVPLELIL